MFVAGSDYSRIRRIRPPKKTISLVNSVGDVDIRAFERSADNRARGPAGITYYRAMNRKITPEVREAIAAIAREFGRQGGNTAAKNMTPEERTARATKASKAAAEKRTAKRLAAEENARRSGR